MTKISVDQALMKAKWHTQKGEIGEAHRLLEKLLITMRESTTSPEDLPALDTEEYSTTIHTPPQHVIDHLLMLLNQRQLSVVIEEASVLVRQYPNAFMIWNILGVAAAQSGILDRAIAAFQRVTSLRPDYADAYNNLGNALRENGQTAEAIIALEKAIEIRPDYADAYNNLGNALLDQDKLDYALEAYNKALDLKPDFIEVHDNKSVVLSRMGYLEEAISSSSNAIQLAPSYAQAHHNLSFTLLNSGRLQEGLEKQEWRWRIRKSRNFKQPIWDGHTSLENKTVLLWHEQGVGDTINWSYYVDHVSKRAKHCILECQEKLVPLLRRSFPSVEVRASDPDLDSESHDFDTHIPMGSLCRHFLNVKSNFKISQSFLIPDQNMVKFWSNRLAELGDGPYIGISWKSAKESSSRKANYASISDWSPILTLPNVKFINLQYFDFEQDLEEICDKFGATVHHFKDLDHFNNLDDVAALCAALDCVISTKITVPFISAGVGTPTKLANWKYSPWNNVLFNPSGPCVEIYEKTTDESWSAVFEMIKQDILNY